MLTVHESVPGHHLQIARAQEREALPECRRYTRFGALTYGMWRAVRLVEGWLAEQLPEG